MDPIRPVFTISETDVYKYMSMDQCVELMRDLFGLVAAGKAQQPLRTFVQYVLPAPIASDTSSIAAFSIPNAVVQLFSTVHVTRN